MVQSKNPVAACDRLLHSAWRSATSGRRLRAVLVARPAGVCRRGGPIGIGVTEVFSHRRRRAIYLSVLGMLRGRGDLDGQRSEQGRTENCQDCLSHRKSPSSSARLRDKRRLAPRRLVVEVMMAHANYYDPANHEAASKIVGQGNFSAKYSAGGPKSSWSKPANSGGLPLADPVQWGRPTTAALREKLMKKLLLAILLISSPAWAQT